LGLSDGIARRAWAVIVAWIIVAALAAPLAGRLNTLITTKEEAFLPPSVESVRAEKALGGARAEPDAVIVVIGAGVSLEAYWRLRGPWASVEWGNATHLSWIDILDEVYATAYNKSLEGVNESVKAFEGFERLWNATLEARRGVEELGLLLNATAKSLVGVDEAFKGYTSAAASLEKARPGLENLLAAVTALCQATPNAYGYLIFDVVRAEYLIESLTGAYERGYMTPGDVEIVVKASNLSNAGIPPLESSLVVEVFNLTLAHGGPANFTNQLAAWEAYTILNATLPAESRPYLGALHNRVASRIVMEPNLKLLASQGLQGLRELLERVLSLTEEEAAPAARDYGWILARRLGKPILGWTVEAYSEHGCDPGAVRQALAYGMEMQLVTNKMNPLVASFIARGVAWGNLSREDIARISAEIVAQEALEAGAPSFLAEAINSSDTVKLILELDPNARGVLVENTTLAVKAAIELLEKHHDNIPLEPSVLEALAEGVPPDQLAIKLVEEKAPPEARPLLEAFSREGIPGSLEGLVNVTIPFLVEEAVKRGVPEAQARVLALEAVKVFLGRESAREAARSMASRILEESWGKVLEEIRGSMVSRDNTTFLVVLFNTTYEDAKRIESSVRGALWRAGFTGARVLATGGVVADHDMHTAALRDVERSDRVSIILVFIILAIVLESVVAVFLPFTGIGLGLAAALGTAYLLARGGVITLTSISRAIMFSTGLGLGIDYATLISRRFREELAVLGDKRKAAAAALRLSARPVAAGATTAAIGFGSLALAWDFPFLKSIGTTVPLAVAFVATASLTFIPALLSIIGASNVLWWPIGAKPRGRGRTAERLGRVVSDKRVAAVLVALIVVAAVPAVYEHMHFQGSHDILLMMPEGTESLEGLKVVNEKLDPGVLYPLYIIPSTPSKAVQIRDAVSRLSCISKVVVENTTRGQRYVLAVPSVMPLSRQGIQCTREVRSAAHSVDPGSLVGGASAISLDIEDLLNARFYHRVLPAAAILMFLSMLAAYGGVVAAIAAVAVVTLAAEYSLGLTIYYYQSVKGMPVVWFLVVTVFTAILGVGMDYNSFSISRAAEECLKRCEPRAVGEAVSKVAILVMGLATIMAGAYGGLTLGSTPYMRMIGVSLLLGVLFAGVLASVALTPPLITLLGRAAWWPWGPRAEAHEAEGVLAGEL
jgi:RND superfamily putative drug exporter